MAKTFKKLPLDGQLKVHQFIQEHREELVGVGIRAARELCAKKTGLHSLTDTQFETVVKAAGIDSIYKRRLTQPAAASNEGLLELSHQFANAARRIDGEIAAVKKEISELQRRPGLQDLSQLQIRFKHIEDRQEQHQSLMYEICHAIDELHRHTRQPRNPVIQEMAKGRKPMTLVRS